MTFEEFISAHSNEANAAALDVSAAVTIVELLKKAWEAGYDFRLQEEELNKGASY